MKEYNFENSGIFLNEEYFLGDFLNDLFNPIIIGKRLRGETKEVTKTYNAIIKINEFEDENLKMDKILKMLFIPDSVLDLYIKEKSTSKMNREDIIKSAVYQLQNNTGKTIPFGNFIRDIFKSKKDNSNKKTIKNEKPEDESEKIIETILSFEKKSNDSLNNEYCFINYNILKQYLTEIKDKILPIDKYNFTFQRELYDLFFKNEEFYKLLSRIILSFIVIQKKDKNMSDNYATSRYYNIADNDDANALRKIWQVINENEKSQINSKISKYFYEGDYNKVLSICDSDNDYHNTQLQLKHMNIISKNIINYSTDIEKELREENTGLAWYALYKLYNGDYSDKYWDPRKKNEALEKAIDKNEPEAVLLKIKELHKDFNRNYKNIDKLLLKIDIEKTNPMQKSMYYFYKGLCSDKNDKCDEAQNYYQEALNLGNKEALNFLEKKPRNINDYEKKFSNKLEDKICIINAFNDNSITLLQSLPEDYCVCTISDVINKTEFSSIIEYNNIKNCLNNILINIERDDLSNKKVIIALLSDNDDNNLNCCLEILDRLFNAALNKKDDKSKLYKFIDTFKIFVKCNYEYASTFIDASISNMGNDIYFETKIIDPYKEAIHNLLYQRPLFIPCLVDNEKDINIAICGSDTKFNLSTVKEAMSVGYIGSTHHVNINIYSKNYKEIKDRMTVEMPGLQLDNLEGLITPNCVENDFTASELYSEINNYRANYIIVNIGNDIENILFAIELRRYLLINSSELNRKPFITVYCQNPNTAFLANRMTLSNVRHEEQWYNNYDLHFFGMSENTYSFDSLVNNKIAEQALAVHFAYCDKEYTGKHNEKNHDTYNLYYSYKYNEDSSINTAISLRYRLFVANCYENRSINEQFTLESDASNKNIKKYQEMCKGNLEEYSKIEQIRWNNFMISRGWQSPTPRQLENYLQNPNLSNHKYMLAKLHPYIANWDALDDDGEICNTIDESLKPFKSPKDMTKNNVKKTTDCLIIFKEKEQKKQLEIEH